MAALAGTGVTTVADGRRATSDAVLCIVATIVDVGVGMIVTDDTMFGLLVVGGADVDGVVTVSACCCCCGCCCCCCCCGCCCTMDGTGK